MYYILVKEHREHHLISFLRQVGEEEDLVWRLFWYDGRWTSSHRRSSRSSRCSVSCGSSSGRSSGSPAEINIGMNEGMNKEGQEYCFLHSANNSIKVPFRLLKLNNLPHFFFFFFGTCSSTFAPFSLST